MGNRGSRDDEPVQGDLPGTRPHVDIDLELALQMLDRLTAEAKKAKEDVDEQKLTVLGLLKKHPNGAYCGQSYDAWATPGVEKITSKRKAPKQKSDTAERT